LATKFTYKKSLGGKTGMRGRGLAQNKNTVVYKVFNICLMAGQIFSLQI
jgi:hypothetical protein